MVGHIVTTALAPVSGLDEARELFADAIASDSLPSGVLFVAAPWGPIAVFADTIREAELIGRSDGFTWVVAE